LSLLLDTSTKNNSTSDGDPIALFDKLHGRWVLMQFAVQRSPYHLCFAVSETEDATGKYHLFKYSTGLSFPDVSSLRLGCVTFTVRECVINLTIASLMFSVSS
jgi:hypothetical protein